ncbi:MAG: NUDIX domain-containing protein [Bdellovibrionota bacterium]|nr:NUDIX domain-containing protein [Bdellovibrionota bacterium]
MSELKPISILIPFKKTDEGLLLWTQIRDSDDELKGTFEFPGGKVEIGESPAEAAVREVLEETSVKVDSGEITRFGQYPFGKLLIYVYLFEDKLGIFGQAGYFRGRELVQMKNQIPPNNLLILNDIFKRFQ